MPTYPWLAKCCDQTIEVDRSFDDYDVPPDACPCGEKLFVKGVASFEYNIRGGGSADTVFPLKLNKAEEVLVKQPNGRYVRTKIDKTFNNPREYDEWLSRTGKINTRDLNDSSVTPSQHSFDEKPSMNLAEREVVEIDDKETVEAILEEAAIPEKPISDKVSQVVDDMVEEATSCL